MREQLVSVHSVNLDSPKRAATQLHQGLWTVQLFFCLSYLLDQARLVRVDAVFGGRCLQQACEH